MKAKARTLRLRFREPPDQAVDRRHRAPEPGRRRRRTACAATRGGSPRVLDVRPLADPGRPPHHHRLSSRLVHHRSAPLYHFDSRTIAITTPPSPTYFTAPPPPRRQPLYSGLPSPHASLIPPSPDALVTAQRSGRPPYVSQTPAGQGCVRVHATWSSDPASARITSVELDELEYVPLRVGGHAVSPPRLSMTPARPSPLRGRGRTADHQAHWRDHATE